MVCPDRKGVRAKTWYSVRTEPMNASNTFLLCTGNCSQAVYWRWMQTTYRGRGSGAVGGASDRGSECWLLARGRSAAGPWICEGSRDKASREPEVAGARA